jgi:hypothetical protein
MHIISKAQRRLENMRGRTETEMAFMGMLKVSSVRSPASPPALPQDSSPETAGQSYRKVSNLFRHDRRIVQVFDSEAAQAVSLQLSAPFQQHVHIALKSPTPLSGGVGQLSVERWSRYWLGRHAREQAIGPILHRILSSSACRTS